MNYALIAAQDPDVPVLRMVLHADEDGVVLRGEDPGGAEGVAWLWDAMRGFAGAANAAWVPPATMQLYSTDSLVLLPYPGADQAPPEVLLGPMRASILVGRTTLEDLLTDVGPPTFSTTTRASDDADASRVAHMTLQYRAAGAELVLVPRQDDVWVVERVILHTNRLECVEARVGRARRGGDASTCRVCSHARAGTFDKCTFWCASTDQSRPWWFHCDSPWDSVQTVLLPSEEPLVVHAAPGTPFVPTLLYSFPFGCIELYGSRIAALHITEFRAE